MFITRTPPFRRRHSPTIRQSHANREAGSNSSAFETRRFKSDRLRARPRIDELARGGRHGPLRVCATCETRCGAGSQMVSRQAPLPGERWSEVRGTPHHAQAGLCRFDGDRLPAPDLLETARAPAGSREGLRRIAPPRLSVAWASPKSGRLLSGYLQQIFRISGDSAPSTRFVVPVH